MFRPRAAVIGLLAMVVVPAATLAAVPQDPPPPTPPPAAAPVVRSTPVPGRPAPAAPAPPVLPADARRVVDQLTQQMIDQLQQLQEMYMSLQRPDDAAAVRTQIQLLRKATGLPEDGSPRADAISMVAYRDRVGETFTFTVTGSADQPVWGTGIYTDDTPLESAAVHAGVLRSGQTGSVRVTVLAGQSTYVGSRQNGIESVDFGAARGSYRIEIGPGTASRPTSLANFRGRFGETISIPAVGALTGEVWGTEIYTDDSSLGAAAVHAGALAPGEFGFVRVTIAGGQASYLGSPRHGVTSKDYGEWSGSFRIARAPQPWVLQLPADVIDATGMISLPSLRKHPGVSFSLVVVGGSGPVRGTDVYTDDSSIAAAAVHAGLLRPGERGWVRVTLLPGQSSYSGSKQHDITSAEAGEWGGSFRLERDVGR
jgi:hypothetical protein